MPGPKQRTDQEVLDLLDQHHIPPTLTLAQAYQEIEQQTAKLKDWTPAGVVPPPQSKIAEAFTRATGFTNWITLRYLLRRRDQIHKRQAQQAQGPAPASTPVAPELPAMTPSQEQFLKKLKRRKITPTAIVKDGTSLLVSYVTEGGAPTTYQVGPKGQERYLGLQDGPKEGGA